MRARMLAIAAVAAAWACGGTTFSTIDTDGGAEGGQGSSSGSSGGSSSGGSSGSGSGSSSGGTSSTSSGGGSGGSSGGGSGGSSGGSSGSSSGSSSGGGGSSCPGTPPTGGTKCPVVGMECEYGSDPNPACNEVISCQSNGWSFPPPAHCLPGTCPATYADVPQNKTCSPQGLDCAYPQGQCNCSSSLPVSTGTVWLCSTPGDAACPEPRARLGASCTQGGLQCDYGACTGGVAEVCQGGYWQRALVACPASTGGG